MVQKQNGNENAKEKVKKFLNKLKRQSIMNATKENSNKIQQQQQQ